MNSLRLGAALRALVVGGLLAGGMAYAAPAARAADLGLPPQASLEAAPYGQVSEFGSGWYLRGDVGYSMNDTVKANYGTFNFKSAKLDETATYGVGAGYKFANWLRGDLTGDWRQRADFHGTTSVPGCCASNEIAKLSGWTVLGNLYLDLGSWSGISPYVGAGIGVATTIVDGYSSKGYSLGSGCYCELPAGAIFSHQTFGKSDNTTLAYAAMAGVAVAVDEHFKLDFGYRYLNIEGANTRKDLYNGKISFKDFAFHEFRIGLRYMID